MTHQARLIESGDAFAMRLLRAGKREEPPTGSEERVLTAIGLSAGLSGWALTKALYRPWLKWMLAGLFVATGLGAFVIAPRPPRPTPLRAEEPSARVDSPIRDLPSWAVLSAAAPTESDAPGAVSFPRKPDASVTAHSRSATAHARPRATPIDELGFVRRARAALHAEDPREALAILDEYARLCRHALFAEEAAVVRVDALMAIKDVERANQVGIEFLSRYPQSPYAQRVRSALFGVIPR